MSRSLPTVAAAAAVAATIALGAVVGVPATASATPPVANTSPAVTITMPSVAYAEYAGIAVQLNNVPNASAISIRIACAGIPAFTPDARYSDPAHPSTITFVSHASTAINGKSCTIYGISNVSNQTVQFSPGSFLTTDKYVPITTVRGEVVTRSALGGL